MILVANWKAYVENLAGAKKLFALAKRLASNKSLTIVLAPPAPLLGALAHSNRSQVAFAAQDVSATTGGAQTAESTAAAYAAAGATYALIGHSERRAAGDTDAIIAEKLSHTLAQGLIPILCVGEKERDGEGRYLSVVREELTRSLKPLSERERTQVIVAYEPIWAIGKSADSAIEPDDLTEMVLYIRKVLAELSGRRKNAQTRVIYGGAVEPANIRALAALSGVDGFLIGHASVDPEIFALFVKHLS